MPEFVLLRAIEEVTEEEWDEMLDINLRGVFFCSQAVTPVMKQQRKGTILNLTSIAGKVGRRGCRTPTIGFKGGCHLSHQVLCKGARSLWSEGKRGFARACGHRNDQSMAERHKKELCPNGPIGG